MKLTIRSMFALVLMIVLGTGCSLEAGFIERIFNNIRVINHEISVAYGGWSVFARIIAHDLLAQSSELVYEITEPYAIAMGIVSGDPRIAEKELIKAIETRNLERIKLLLAVDGLNVNNRNALLVAVRGNWMPGVSLLLTHQTACINTLYRDIFYRKTLLHQACWAGSTPLVSYLLTYPDIAVNSLDQMGNTPLMIAAEYGHAQVVQLLLALPDIEVNRNDAYRNISWYETDKNESKITTPLIKVIEGFLYNHDKKDALSNRIEVVRLLLGDPRTQVNAVNDQGQTALMRAVRHKSPDLLRTLLHHSAIDVHRLDRKGRTARDIAREADHGEIVEILEAHEQEQEIMVKPACS